MPISSKKTGIAETAAAVGVRPGSVFWLQADAVNAPLKPPSALCASVSASSPFGRRRTKLSKSFDKLVVARIGDELVEIAGNRADVFGDAPFVVVEDADEFFRRVRRCCSSPRRKCRSSAPRRQKCRRHFRSCRVCRAPPPCPARRRAPCPRGPRRNNRVRSRCAARNHSGRPSGGWCGNGSLRPVKILWT